MDKYNVEYPYNVEYLFSHKKEWNTYTCHNMNEPWKDTKLKKPDTKDQYYMIPFMWNVQNKFIGTKSFLVVPRADGIGQNV